MYLLEISPVSGRTGIRVWAGFGKWAGLRNFFLISGRAGLDRKTKLTEPGRAKNTVRFSMPGPDSGLKKN